MPGIKLIGNITIAVVLRVRRLPRLPRRGHRRRARGVPALPAPVLRADAGHLAVLQHLPVAPAPPWRSCPACSRRSRASPSRRSPTRLAEVRGDVRFEQRRVLVRRGPAGAARPRPRRSPPGRPSRWSAPPAPARPPSPSCCPGSTTRSAAGSRSTASTCATSTSRRCARAVVMVTQENYLFGGTVADNIRFGRPEATMEEVVAAAQAIGAHEFITAAAAGLRHRRGQQGRPALGRPAPARRVRAGVPGRPRRADPRRGDLVASTCPPSGSCSARCARSWPTGPR